LVITEVRVHPLRGVGRIRALASVTLDSEFVIHDLRIIEGDNGLFVAMPARRNASGDYYDVAHPITAEARAQLQSAVLEAFERTVAAEAPAS